MNCKKCLTNFHACDIILKQCGYGGIGRRVWFRSICSQGHAGSSPVIRTKSKECLSKNYEEASKNS